MRQKVYVIALVVFLGVACLCCGSHERPSVAGDSRQDRLPGSSRQAPAPLPPDVSINVPDPSLPEQVKSLLGKWAGQWNSRWGWDSALYVEKIDGDSAQVVFAWGEYNTSRNSCHCNPNWVRVEKARVAHSGNKVTLDFYTPTLRPAWLRTSHTVSGSADELWGAVTRPSRGAHNRSSGHYAYSFTVDESKPNVMEGHFISAGASQLRIEMKKVNLGNVPGE